MTRFSLAVMLVAAVLAASITAVVVMTPVPSQPVPVSCTGTGCAPAARPAGRQMDPLAPPPRTSTRSGAPSQY